MQNFINKNPKYRNLILKILKIENEALKILWYDSKINNKITLPLTLQNTPYITPSKFNIPLFSK